MFEGYNLLKVLIETLYLTIIPRARMGSESIAHEGEAIDSEPIRARGIIALLKSN